MSLSKVVKGRQAALPLMPAIMNEGGAMFAEAGVESLYTDDRPETRTADAKWLGHYQNQDS